MPVKCSGNAASEYGFLLALLVVAAIAALLLLGGNMSNLLASVGSNLGRQTPVTSGEDLLDSGGTGGEGDISEPVGPTARVTVTMADGTQLQVDNFPADPARTVQTAGASGTTEMMAAAIRQLADQLRDAGKLTTAQHQSLLDLANAGHDMAAAEKLMEQQLTPCNNDLYCAMYVLQSDPGKFSDSYSIGGDIINELAYLQGEEYGGNGLTLRGQLMRELEEARNRGALDDPQVRAAVEGMTQQIAALGQNFGAIYNDAYTDFANGGTSQVPDHVAILVQRYADESHGLSAGICRTGGDTDSGVRCR